MTWVKEANFPQEMNFRSSAVNEAEIAKDLEEVIGRCLNNKISDGAETATTIIIVGNATNGYMEVFFGNFDDMDYIGKSQYMMNLPALYELSGNHEDGSFHFDKVTKHGTILFIQSEYGQQVKQKYKLRLYDDFNDYIDL